MFMLVKKLPAQFCRNAKCYEPVGEWLKRLPRGGRQVIGKDIQKVEFGWPLGLPVCRPLGRGIWEIRSESPSRRIARTLFCIVEGQMILLDGSVKKTRKTPERNVKLAQTRKKELEHDQEEIEP